MGATRKIDPVTKPIDQPDLPRRQELHHLRREIDRLTQENQDLRLALSTIAEHGDVVETELYETNTRLQSAIAEKLEAEKALQALVELLMKKKDDLEIVIETIMQHGDMLDMQWQGKLHESHVMANLDELTQIANRRKFDSHLQQQWQQTQQAHQPIAVILCDIDYFKQYNDHYGHIAGDHCLQEVAHRLSGVVNRPCDLAARYGGEEFALTLPQTEQTRAIAVAHRLQTMMRDRCIPHPASPIADCLTFSIGIAWCYPQPTQSPQSLVYKADRMLYQAKNLGRNQIVCQPLTP